MVQLLVLISKRRQSATKKEKQIWDSDHQKKSWKFWTLFFPLSSQHSNRHNFWSIWSWWKLKNDYLVEKQHAFISVIGIIVVVYLDASLLWNNNHNNTTNIYICLLLMSTFYDPNQRTIQRWIWWTVSLVTFSQCYWIWY
jgi:hypothetical protein